MKAFIVALLVGACAARTKLMGYSNEDTPRTITGSNGIFDIAYTYNFEATYGTAFDAGVNADDTDVYYESYGLNFDAYMTTSFEFNIAGLTTYTVGLDLNLLNVTPYRQVISYTTPGALLSGNKASFDIAAAGEYDLNFLEVTTTSTMGMMTISKSIADYLVTVFSGAADATLIAPAFADFTLSTAAFDETYLSWSLAKQFGFDTATWYGTQQYYAASLFGTI